MCIRDRLIVDPRDAFTPEEEVVLQDYLNRGGSLFYFGEPRHREEQNPMLRRMFGVELTPMLVEPDIRFKKLQPNILAAMPTKVSKEKMYQLGGVWVFTMPTTAGIEQIEEDVYKRQGYNYEEYEAGSKKYEESRLPHGGEYNQTQNTGKTWSWRNQLEWLKVFNGVHSLSVMVGHEIRSTESKGSALKAYGYMPDRGKLFVNIPPIQKETYPITVNNLLRTVPNITDTEANYLSYYGCLLYTSGRNNRRCRRT